MSLKPSGKRPQRTVLRGRYCRLEPLHPDHAQALYTATAGEGEAERYRWLFSNPPPDEGGLAEAVSRDATSEDPLHFAVVDVASGRAGGRQALMRVTPEHGVIEIGSILWGRGIARTRLATEALYLHAAYCFDTLDYRRFEWKCNALNLPSQAAARRFGFTFEGVFRQHMIIKGDNRNTAWFSMLDREWPARKAEFERWLDPANFDTAGLQKTPLRHEGAAA